MTREASVRDALSKAVAEGIVLLEHDGMLPLKRNEKVAVFGRAQFEYIKSGSGSGGLVVCPYVTNIGDELKRYVSVDMRAEEYYRKWIAKHPYDNGDNWEIPQSQQEAPIDEKFVEKLSAENEKAVIVISRLCGEAFELKTEKGGYYLSDEEDRTISLATKHFKHVCVVLNTGNPVDMRWVKKYSVGTVAYVWQGGQEGGLGVARALAGELYPSGRLVDTIAENLSDYPATGNYGDESKNIHVEDIFVGYRYFETFAREKVLYPFGYGLSYTNFSYSETVGSKNHDTVTVKTKVTNIGGLSGKEVVQVYVGKPQGVLCKPLRELVGFQKTKLLKPGESETVTLKIKISDLASYEDRPGSEFSFSYILEKGAYAFYLGANVRDAQNVFGFVQEDTVCIRKCSQALAPNEAFRRISFDGQKLVYENVPLDQSDLKAKISAQLPDEITYTGDKGFTLQDVANGKISPDEFVAQFCREDLCLLVRGEGMSSPKAHIDGTAGCYGGVAPVWINHGVPVVTTVDGPCGVRLSKKDGYATCIPTGTLLASMWAPELLSDVFDIFARELKEYALDIALAPGINIHRHVLGGRNFEYFSEDPYLTGVTASAVVKCFADNGIGCTVKHFAVNSQEFGRRGENEVVSERALREIYLKGFETVIKSGNVPYIMTAFNRINGTSAASNFDLLTTILRNEWGYKGMVMTDWWPLIDSHYNSTASKYNLSSIIRAQADLFMVTPDGAAYKDDLLFALDNGYLTLGELQRCAKNILFTTINALSFKTFDRLKVFNAEFEDMPALTITDANKFDFTLDDSGRYKVLLTYSLALDETIQSEEKIIVNGYDGRVILLKGTEKACENHSFMIHLHTGDTVELKGPAQISEIQIYKYKNT